MTMPVLAFNDGQTTMTIFEWIEGERVSICLNNMKTGEDNEVLACGVTKTDAMVIRDFLNRWLESS